MEKRTFYSREEKVIYTFSIHEIIEALCRVYKIETGKISGESIDDDGSVEIIQIFEKKVD